MSAAAFAPEHPVAVKNIIQWLVRANELTPIAILLLAGGCFAILRAIWKPSNTNGLDLSMTIAAAIGLWLLGSLTIVAINRPRWLILLIYGKATQLLLLTGMTAAFTALYIMLRAAAGRTSLFEPYPLAVLRLQNTYDFILGKWCPEDWEHCKRGTSAWLTLPEAGAYCNVMLFGPIGSGKTTEVMTPLILQTLGKFPDVPDMQPSMLIIDYKGDLAVDVYRWATALGREKDVRIIRPDIVEKNGVPLIPAAAYASISPLQGFDQPALMANELQDALESVKDKRSPDYFQNIQKEFLMHAFALLLEHSPQTDLADVHAFVSSNDLRKSIVGTCSTSAAKRSAGYFEQEFSCFSAADQADLLRGLASQLALLSNSVVRRAFCPTRPGSHPPLETWHDCLVEKPRIVVFSLPPALYTPGLSRLLALLTLRSFQQAMTRRSDATFAGNRTRVVTLYADEAHAVFNRSLAQFLAVSRQARVINILATQGVTQIPRDFRDELLSGCRTRVLLASSDETGKMFQDSLGAVSDVVETVSFSESHRGTNRDTGGTAATRSHSYSMRERPRFSTTTLGHIPRGQGVAHLFNGASLAPSCRIETAAFYRLPFYLLDPTTHPVVACEKGKPHTYKRKWLVGKLTCQTCKKTLTTQEASDFYAVKPALEAMRSNTVRTVGGN